MKQIQAQLTAVMSVASQLTQLYLAVPQIARDARPGQFVTCLARDTHDPYLRLAMPISSIGTETITLLLNHAVPAQRDLIREIGESIDLLGPLGHGFEIPHGAQNLLLLAEGVGIAPMLCLADHSLARGCNVTLLTWHPAQTPSLPSALLPRAVEHHAYSISPAWTWSELDLAAMLAWADQTYVAISEPLRDALTQQLRQDPIRWRRGLVQAWLWQPMACGLGICNACSISTRKGIQHVCSDGPVFDLYDLE